MSSIHEAVRNPIPRVSTLLTIAIFPIYDTTLATTGFSFAPWLHQCGRLMLLSDGQKCNNNAAMDRCSIKGLKSRLSCLRRDTDSRQTRFFASGLLQCGMVLRLPDGWICGVNATLKIIQDLDLLMSRAPFVGKHMMRPQGVPSLSELRSPAAHRTSFGKRPCRWR
jgi:hypothetical protein